MVSGRAARLRLGTAGLLGAVLVLAGCQTTQNWPPVREGTGPPAPIIVLRSSILHSVLAEHGELAGTFAGRMTYLVAPSGQGQGQGQALAGLAGTVKNTYIYKSYAAFAADVAAGRLPSSVHAVLYDIEKWPATRPWCPAAAAPSGAVRTCPRRTSGAGWPAPTRVPPPWSCSPRPRSST